MERDGEKSLAKVFRLLEALGGSEDGLSGREAAAAAELPASTGFRMLKFLNERGYLSKDGARYRLGTGLMRLGILAAKQNPLRRVARPMLVELADATRETVHLGELRNGQVAYIDKVEGHRPLRLRSVVGLACPLHCTGIGKALWAFLPEAEREALLASTVYTVHTPTTIASAKAMRKELGRIRARGYAIDNMEHEDGVYCLGAPVLDARGHAVAAVSLAGAVGYLRGRTGEYARLILKATHDIAAATELE